MTRLFGIGDVHIRGFYLSRKARKALNELPLETTPLQIALLNAYLGSKGNTDSCGALFRGLDISLLGEDLLFWEDRMTERQAVQHPIVLREAVAVLTARLQNEEP